MANAGAETSRIYDGVRDPKIRSDISSMLNQRPDSFLLGSYQGLAKQRHHRTHDVHRVGRDFPRVSADDVVRKVQQCNLKEARKSWNNVDFSSIFDEAESCFHGLFNGYDESDSLIARFKRNLPYFDGFWQAEDLMTWIEAIEDFFEELNPPEHVKCKIVANKMKGRAYYWWKQLQDDRNKHGDDEITSWPRMKNLLLKRFTPNNCSTKVSIEPVRSKPGRKDDDESLCASRMSAYEIHHYLGPNRAVHFDTCMDSECEEPSSNVAITEEFEFGDAMPEQPSQQEVSQLTTLNAQTVEGFLGEHDSQDDINTNVAEKTMSTGDEMETLEEISGILAISSNGTNLLQEIMVDELKKVEFTLPSISLVDVMKINQTLVIVSQMDLTSSNATPNKHIKPKALSLKTIAYCDGVLENHFEKGDTKSRSVGVGGNAKVAGFLFDPGGMRDVQSLHIVNMGLISSGLENGVCCALTNQSEFMNGGTILLNFDPGGIDSIDKRRHCGDFDYNNVERDMEDYTTTYSLVKRVVRMLEILYYLLHTRRKSWYIWDCLDKKAFLHDTLSTLITADLKDGCFPASNFTSSCNLCPVHRGELLILQAGDKKLLTKESVGSMVTDVSLQIHALLEIHLACEVTLEELMLNNVKGAVVLVFQPSKEGGEGAEKIVDARALDHVSVVFRVHLNLMSRVSLVRMNFQFLPGEVQQAYIIIMVVFLFDPGGSTSLSNTWGFKNCIFLCSNMIEGSIEGSSNLTVKETFTTYGDDIDSLAVALNVSHVVQLNLDIFVDLCKSIAFILQKEKSGNIFELLSATYSLSISKELKSSVRSPAFECTEVFIIILSLTNVGIETTLDILYEELRMRSKMNLPYLTLLALKVNLKCPSVL